MRILAKILVLFACLAWTGTAQAKVPSRVISLSPIITETIFLLEADDRLIADTTYCNEPEAARYKEKIGSVIRMNVEKIVALKPDLVIASPLSREKQLATLEALSIPVIRTTNPRTFEEMCEATLALGNTLGATERAQRVVKEARQAADAILARTQNLAAPTVFLQVGIKPLHAADTSMFVNEYIRYCGGRNIVESRSSGIFSREKVVARDPDIILIATMGSSKKAGTGEKKKWEVFPSMKAVQKNRIHVLDPELICSPTPVTFVRGLAAILPLIHPELQGIADAGSLP